MFTVSTNVPMEKLGKKDITKEMDVQQIKTNMMIQLIEKQLALVKKPNGIESMENTLLVLTIGQCYSNFWTTEHFNKTMEIIQYN